VIDHAEKMGAWLLKDADHQYMTMRRHQIEGMDYPEELFDDLAENMMYDDNESGEEADSGESEGSSEEEDSDSEEEGSDEESGDEEETDDD